MSKLIKNAIVYKAELPGAAALETHLQQHRFKEMMSLDRYSAGFVEIPATGELVSTFEGGLAFAVRYDTKILPASVVRAEAEKLRARIEKQECRKVGRNEFAEIKKLVTYELLAKALTKTAIITCYYDTANQFLIVPVSSKQLASVATSQLVHAVGSMKTTTINISDVKLGLTTKVREFLDVDDGDEDTFGHHFVPGGKVRLVGDTEKATFDLTALDKAQAGILESLNKGFSVAELGMVFDRHISFRLAADFHLKGLTFDYEPTEAEDKHEAWQFDASIQVLELGVLINAMCDLLGYREPEAAKEAA